MFIFDNTLTTSVTDATVILNEGVEDFDWQDQSVGVPVFVHSGTVWYKIKHKNGMYGCNMKHRDAPPPGLPTLRKKTNPRKHKHVPIMTLGDAIAATMRNTFPTIITTTTAKKTEDDIAAAKTIVGKADLDKKRLEMVQTWASMNLQFPGFAVSPWKIDPQDRSILYMQGPLLHHIKRTSDVPPILPDGIFREKLAKFGIDGGMIETGDNLIEHHYRIVAPGVKYIYRHYTTKEALKALALGVVQAKRGAGDVVLAQSDLFDRQLFAEIDKMMMSPTVQKKKVTLDVTDFDCTLSIPHMTSTDPEDKSREWVLNELFGDGERVNLIRSWFAKRASDGDPLVIVSFGDTVEICEVLEEHGLLRYVSRVYALAQVTEETEETEEMHMEVWENLSRPLAAPRLPTPFVIGTDPSSPFSKAAIVHMLHTTLQADRTLFHDDDQKNVKAVRDLGLSAVLVEPVGVVRNGMSKQQLAMIATL
jgi:FMN phosphatase YigB (HAD superfamily)